jgi:hypothetical protein
MGLGETLLLDRFGPPDESSAAAEHRWNSDNESRECILFRQAEVG